MTLKHAAKRGESTAAACALCELEANHSVVFDMSELEQRAFVDAFNADQVSITRHWLDVLDGTRKLTDLSVNADEMLPLVEVFGTDAAKLETLRRDRLKRLSKPVRPKTSAKFERIALQLAVVLQRRPVELLTAADLERLALQWQEDGNTATTIRDKLTILASLITPVSEAGGTLCKRFVPRTALMHRKRHPFTGKELQAFRTAIEDRELPEDDVRLVELMTLTGARLGEVLQLKATDIEHLAGNQFSVAFSDDEHTLKNGTSVREIPIDLTGLTEFRKWIDARVASGQRLFPDATPDKYGHFGNAESKRLNRTLRMISSDRRLVLQSTRNTAGVNLRRAGVDPRVRRRLLGHADIDIHDRHYDPAELLTAEDLMCAAPTLNSLVIDTQPARSEMTS
ncbi:tyrosine-type recombinase/integrase [Parazoarcus communis]|uniref:tyrosine-type recombinase/integrase n=1 Tax=Parazoarcus communis TaxID=41977 RepID=UPI00131F3644|nr:tyrosine-type recombinase/integrase [Parazoarcus communis]